GCYYWSCSSRRWKKVDTPGSYKLDLKRVYGVAVGVMGIDPGYFLDEVSFEAIGLAWEAYQKSCRESWEQTRIIAFNVASPYLEGKPSKQEFMPLEWDSESKEIEPGKESESKKAEGKERFDEITTELNLN
ncbi:unnamed protein product, partial [marine sediment metagenome]